MWLNINKTTQSENGQSSNKFLQGRHTDGQEAHEKMLNIPNYQRNANQNHNEVSPHTSQNASLKKSIKQHMLERCGEKGTLPHCW